MQENQKTIYVFLLGAFILLVLLFAAMGHVMAENKQLKSQLADLTENREPGGENNALALPGVFPASTGLLKFQAEMTARKYPVFSRVVKTVYAKSLEHHIEPRLLMSIIETESSFNPYAVSSAGAYGLMQVNYSIWKDELAIDHRKIFDISYNLELGIRILKNYLKIAKNDVYKALHYYNNGFTLENYGYVGKVVSTVFY